MKKGELNRRISIWRAETVDDGTATVEGEPAEIGKRWAKKQDVSDGERLRASQQGQELATRFTVLSDSLTRTITGKDILMCEGVSFQVVGTKDIGARRHDGIEITCSSQPDITA
ncbi:head-tail adaptor protein [Novosphingobium sp. AP12]|uniref:head-tail adaptor protein n=1 Tax=Novosphingobium sp. AP12 TaxID=1144305 RepID=UPI00027205EA|nr:head-tail adaptor protein [Novosphingobium sp. AP12]EJL23974.1 bacteriophage head-tail adaptor [Novosphingobium sp. AP12]